MEVAVHDIAWHSLRAKALLFYRVLLRRIKK